MVGITPMPTSQKKNTPVLTGNLTSVRQWQRELLDKTSLSEDAIAEYSGERKSTGPVTLHAKFFASSD